MKGNKTDKKWKIEVLASIELKHAELSQSTLLVNCQI